MLDREEYIEQAHLFRTLRKRLEENRPMQELLGQVREELLATTKLPMAVDYFRAELLHSGAIGPAIRRLDHYFTPFQGYLISEAEDDRGRFDLRIALEILAADAQYRSGEPTPQGVFLFQFESLCRNRLRYERGLEAILRDPLFTEPWREWIATVRRQIGLVDFADLVYLRSRFCELKTGKASSLPVLFGEKEGRIALANRHKDPLLLFAALQRQLGYPVVPRPQPIDDTPTLIPQLLRRMERLETRIKLLEEENRAGAVDLSRFYQPPESPTEAP